MSGVVLDANLGIALVIPLPYSESAASKIQAWQKEGAALVVPGLWGYEVASALRKAIIIDLIAMQEAKSALSELWSLGIKEVPSSLELHRNSLDWADRIGQTVAYDSAYLALAEKLELEFWTADRSLAASARASGATWVHWLEE
jgi:predicted nucleic acid-binding protein